VVNLWYGRKKKLAKIAIGTVWTPGLPAAAGASTIVKK
jgi:preprotein translocase subunit SecD